jgi:hypothetical protein
MRRRSCRVMRQVRIKLCPSRSTCRPDDRAGCHQIRIVERTSAHAHWQPRWLHRSAIHLCAARRTKAALDSVAAVCSHPEFGQWPFIMHRIFREKDIHRRRTRGDPLTIPTPTHARTNRFCINGKADRAAQALAGVGQSSTRSAAP